MLKTKNIMLLLAAVLVCVLPASALFAQPAVGATLELQFDASNINGANNVGLIDGQLITTWNDLSGNARNVTADAVGTPTFRMNYTQGSTFLTSGPAVQFAFATNGSDQLTGTTPGVPIIAAYPFYLFAVTTGEDNSQGIGAPPANPAGQSAAISLGNSAVAGNFYEVGPVDSSQPSTTNLITAGARYTAGGTQGTIGTINIRGGDLHVLTGLFSATDAQLRIDREANGLGNFAYPAIFVTDQWRLGNGATTTSPSLAEYTGHLSEVLVYSGALTPAEITAIEDYLITKWHGVFADSRGTLQYVAQTSGFTYPTTQTATITNTGLTTLTISALTPNTGSFPGDAFTVDPAVTFPIQVAPNFGEFTFDVGLVPADVLGTRDATIDVTDDWPGNLQVPVTFAVLGGIPDSMVCYFDFEETIGFIVNDLSPSGNDNDGDVIGANLSGQGVASVNTGFSRAYLSNNGGAAAPFNNTNFISIDGTLDQFRTANCPADFLIGTGDFSFSYWSNIAVADVNNQVIIGSCDWNRALGTPPGRDGVTNFRSGSSIPAIYADNGEFRTFQSLDAPNTWHNWVITVRQGQGRFYRDGVLLNQNNSVSGHVGNTTTPFVIGNNAIPGGGIGGVSDCRFDEFAAWSRVLDSAEVQQIYDQGLQGITVLNVGPQPTIVVSDDRQPTYAPIATSNSLTVTVTNNGQSPLFLDPNITITGADASRFSFDTSGFDNSTTHSVFPGTPLDIPMFFVPGNAGTTNAVLNFTHNTAVTGTSTNYSLNLIVGLGSLPTAVQRESWELFK